MAKYGILADAQWCSGCHSCEVACRQEKAIASQEEWGVKLAEFGPERLAGAWYWNYVPVPSSLCDLCASKLEEGKAPACVHHCLAKCMEAVPLEELPRRMAELGDGVACFMP